MRALYITPLGKALYRREGEFDPSSRGVWASAKTFLYPTPSTVAGVLAYHMFNRNSIIDPPGSKDWVEEYKQILGSDIQLSGPFLKAGEDIYVFYERKSNVSLIKFEGEVLRLCRKRDDIAITSPEDSGSGGEPPPSILVNLDLSSVVGSRILNRLAENEKITIGNVEEGAGGLYTVDFLYPEAIASILEVDEISYIYLIRNGNIPRDIKGVFRLGGEGSLANLDQTNEEIFDKLNDFQSEFYYVVSPILIPTGEDPEATLENELNMEVKYISGELKLYGAGLASYSRKWGFRMARRPIYAAVMPGSIIKFSGKLKGIHNVGKGKEIGYGTIIPVDTVECGERDECK